MPIRFRIRGVPLVATAIVAAIGITLGQWQTRRGDEKEATQAKMMARQAAPPIELGGAPVELDIDQAEYRHVRLTGRFIPGWTTYLDNRPYKGVPGFYVLTPFRIANSATTVLVERGWVPRDMNDRTSVPALPTPPDAMVIDGVLRRNAGHLLQLGNADALRPGAIMQNLDMAAFAKASQLQIAPFLIEQSGDLKDGLVRDWPVPSLGIERHRGYAVQWYALALMAVIFFVVTGCRSGKK